MHEPAHRLLATAAGIVSLLTFISCGEGRLSFSGDVRDTEDRSIEGCNVQLVVQIPLAANWTGTISREATTDAAGQFSFDVLVVFKSFFRLRLEQPGYEAWPVDGSWPSAPRRFHITLSRAPRTTAPSEAAGCGA